MFPPVLLVLFSVHSAAQVTDWDGLSRHADRSASSGDPAATPATAISPELAAKLLSPFGSAVVSKPLRESLNQIAAIGQVNLWIDRRVDPSLAVTIPAGPKTVFQAMEHAARSVGLQAAAAGNVVIVGRPEWVTTLGGAILDLPSASSQVYETEQIQWLDLTTPSRALYFSGVAGGPDTLALPHDLWPAVSWTGISPNLAALLIASQFDLMPVDADDIKPIPPSPIALFQPQATADLGSADLREPLDKPDPSPRKLVLRPLQAPETLALAYPNGPHVPQLRASALAADAQSRFRTGRPGAPLELTASPAAHAAAAAAYLTHARPSATQAPDLDGTRFSLRLRDAPAADVFAQLAGTAGRQLQISDEAAEACRNRVTLEGHEVTLRELTQRIADAVGVTAAWSAESLRIDRPRPGSR
jgi:hypothetical protein